MDSHPAQDFTLPEEEAGTDPTMSMFHPKNQVNFHEIIINPDVDATRDFTGLAPPQTLCKMLNKSMKLGKHFRVPDVTQADLTADPEATSKFMNTTRNGFVSALAMSHNYHLPLILSPNDVWLAVLQGFRLHLAHCADKPFIQNTFKDLAKVPKTVKKHFKLAGDDLHPDITKIKDDKFEAGLFAAIEASMNKVWNEKHLGQEFAPNDDLGGKVMPVERLTDVFSYVMTSELEIGLAQDRRKMAEHEKAPEGDPPAVLSEDRKAELAAKAQRVNQFYNCIFAMTTLNSSHMVLHDQKSEEHCGVPKVKFLGTLRDWKILRKKIVYLDRFGCHKWLDVLLPVINKFIAAIEDDEVDEEFWSAMYTVVPRTTVTSSNKVHGWICSFFPYTAKQ